MTLAPSDSLLDLLPHYKRSHTLGTDSFAQLGIAAGQFATWFAEEYERPASIADLERATVHDWMDDLAEDLAAATVNTKRAQLLALWGEAAEQKLVPPPWRVKRFDPGEEPPNAWSLDEFARLLHAAGDEPGGWDGIPAGLCWEMGLLLVYDTAARFGELWKARASDVNLEAGTWTVPARNTKTRRGRIYPLTHSLAVLRSAAGVGERERLWPFPFGKRQSYVHWDRILARAGLPAGRRQKWHCLRRTAESHAAAAKGPRWAAEAVGHTEAVARRHYLSPTIVATPAVGSVLPAPPARPLAIFAG